MFEGYRNDVAAKHACLTASAITAGYPGTGSLSSFIQAASL